MQGESQQNGKHPQRTRIETIHKRDQQRAEKEGCIGKIHLTKDG